MMSHKETNISTLRCEPYFADVSGCKDGYYGLASGCLLWRIFVDEVGISDGSLPFLASDESVELAANKCIPYFGDGGDYVIVRLAGDKILWFGIYSYFAFWEKKLLIDTVYVFDTVQYQQAIEQATTALIQPQIAKEPERISLRKFFDYLFGAHEAKLPLKPSSTSTKVKPIPTLTSLEIKDALLEVFPYDWDLPLYRMPELADDRRGARLYRAVWEAISLEEIRIYEPPPTTIEVRIGLDKDVFVESVWQVGKVGDDIAILFVSEPHFPLWLSGFKSIEKLLSDGNI